jgi:hypothetical protein
LGTQEINPPCPYSNDGGFFDRLIKRFRFKSLGIFSRRGESELRSNQKNEEVTD